MGRPAGRLSSIEVWVRDATDAAEREGPWGSDDYRRVFWREVGDRLLAYTCATA